MEIAPGPISLINSFPKIENQIGRVIFLFFQEALMKKN